MGGFLGNAATSFAKGYLSPKAKAKRATKKLNKSASSAKSTSLPLTGKDGYTPNLAQQPVPSYKRGGKVKKTGLAKLHKGEKVIPVHKRQKRAAKKR